ncbi:helix-hairpin-helix domain-containing protein [Halarchaeum sp. P4]|uniref:helix-hairpin-helix domain-containing protein n=1 Tax=Halarchaeum sp. P4 TaxID=3421639 RepID=UPI003EB6B054
MDDSTRLVRDATNRFKLKVSLPGGRYQLSLDDRAAIFLTDTLGYAERDTIPNPLVPLLVAMGDAWFPRERDVDQIIDDLPDNGQLSKREQAAAHAYVTSNYVQERHVSRVLNAVDRTPLDTLTRDDLKINSLPKPPGDIDLNTTASDTDADRSQSNKQDGDTDVDVADQEELRERFEDIPGIGPHRSKALVKTPYASLEDLADARPTDLAATSDLSEGIAAVAIEGARELVGHVKPMEDRLESQTGVPAAEFEKALASLAAGGIPPSDAEPTLRIVYGPTIADIDAVSGAQAYYLWEAGYHTPTDIITASQDELEAVTQLGSATAPKIQTAAHDLLDGLTDTA